MYLKKRQFELKTVRLAPTSIKTWSKIQVMYFYMVADQPIGQILFGYRKLILGCSRKNHNSLMIFKNEHKITIFFLIKMINLIIILFLKIAICWYSKPNKVPDNQKSAAT
jgi:hypothetical protein